MSTITKPEHWTVGAVTKDGWKINRTRAFFAVLQKGEGRSAEWAVEFIDGTRKPAKSSAHAGEQGRAYRDRQQAKGVVVKRTRTTTKAPAKKTAAKAPAKKAPAKKTTTRKAPAKKA
jgi:DNA-binding protein HU-beta